MLLMVMVKIAWLRLLSRFMDVSAVRRFMLPAISTYRGHTQWCSRQGAEEDGGMKS